MTVGEIPSGCSVGGWVDEWGIPVADCRGGEMYGKDIVDSSPLMR
jgi:hypothetical protein